MWKETRKQTFEYIHIIFVAYKFHGIKAFTYHHFLLYGKDAALDIYTLTLANMDSLYICKSSQDIDEASGEENGEEGEEEEVGEEDPVEEEEPFLEPKSLPSSGSTIPVVVEKKEDQKEEKQVAEPSQVKAGTNKVTVEDKTDQTNKEPKTPAEVPKTPAERTQPPPPELPKETGERESVYTANQWGYL